VVGRQSGSIIEPVEPYVIWFDNQTNTRAGYGLMGFADSSFGVDARGVSDGYGQTKELGKCRMPGRKVA
jgi:hypothetical protein